MKRDRIEIIRDILIICRNDSKKTKIAHEVNLNFRNAEVYLQWLIDRELITRGDNFFKITQKGARLLSDLQKASKFLDLQ